MIFWFSSPSPSSVGRFFIDWSPPVFLLSLLIIGLGGFSPVTWLSENYQLPHRARMFSFITWISSSVSHNWVGRFFTRFLFLNRRLLYSTKLAPKRQGSCNVMVTRSTNHMISIRDHSHNLVTWSRHVTYKLHSNIKALLIPISVSLFLCYDYIRVCFIIEARVFILS